MAPRVGNTHVAADGRISFSAKFTNCCTKAWSFVDDPRSCSLLTGGQIERVSKMTSSLTCNLKNIACESRICYKFINYHLSFESKSTSKSTLFMADQLPDHFCHSLPNASTISYQQTNCHRSKEIYCVKVLSKSSLDRLLQSYTFISTVAQDGGNHTLHSRS